MSIFLLLAILVLPEEGASENLQLLRQVVNVRPPACQTELLSGAINEYSRGIKEKEFTFEAARSAENELVVSTRILPQGRKEVRATLLRSDSSFSVFKNRNARDATVSAHSKSLQHHPALLHKELGSDRKELHANLFEDYFFREYLDPVINKTVGYYLVDFQRTSSVEFHGTLFFDATVDTHFRDKSISFVLTKDGRLKQWSYPLRFEGDPKTYRTVIDFDRTSDGILRSVEEKCLDGETVGYRKSYSIEKHEINIPLPPDQFSLSRFGLQERGITFPLFWLIFVVVAIGCLSLLAILHRVWSRL